MRSAQKQNVLDVINSLYQAHKEIKSALEQKNQVLAQNMIVECQKFAISLGESIEKLEKQGHVTVSYIEEYCELLFRVYEEVAGAEYNGNNICKNLKKQLMKVENSAKSDIVVRKEAVFLPYKASMWDSLESVWKAADADENCDAYVIPIPYYDKNPDGSFREMHYEGDQYPDCVPITRYDAFDLEAHHPDAIYIHNPYDAENFVTSVHPFFYSANLKKFTENLIYIPYFVLDEIRPDEDEKIKGMKHFCTTPGVRNADRVIVQSEDMRQIYIRVLLEEFNDYSRAAKKYWGDKILGLGSPKFDKVINTKKEDIAVPENWRKIICRPDGSRKKIILYNTSIVGFLAHDEKMLAKLEDVFRIFREHREEAALLWRPHPLIESTLVSMRPELWEAYAAIRERYQTEGWGIYDDTADIDRAIILSDAYYGDASSVVHLYKKTGKPVMMQRVELIYALQKGGMRLEKKESGYSGGIHKRDQPASVRSGGLTGVCYRGNPRAGRNGKRWR